MMGDVRILLIMLMNLYADHRDDTSMRMDLF